MAQASRGSRSGDRSTSRPLAGETSYYQPVDTASGDSPWEEPRRCCCFDTQGRFFNLIVGTVLVANALFLAVEADLGLLGGGRPAWVGLDADMDALAITGAEQEQVISDVRQGVEADAKVKSQLGDQLNLGQDVNSALELNSGVGHLNRAAYTVVEFVFVAFYVLEFLLRLCDLGCPKYCHDTWFALDFICVATGLLDICLPFVVSINAAVLTVLRVSRVLRIFRLFRVNDGLRVLAKPFVEALSVVMRSALIVLIISFVCAVALTSLAGQQSYMWEGDQAAEVDAWFGSIGKSMQTLFAIMTLSGWDHIVRVLAEVIPGPVVAPFFVLYIMVCTFAVVGLIAGAISDSFMSKAKEDDREMAKMVNKSRSELLTRLTNVLAANCDADKNGYLSREELTKALESHPVVMEKLRRLDIDATIDELLLLFDRLSLDAVTNDGSVKVGSMAEAIVTLAGEAQASGIFDLKYLAIAHRREAIEKNAELKAEMVTRFQAAATALVPTSQEVTECKRWLGQVDQNIVALQKNVSNVAGKLEQLEKAQALEKKERSEAMGTLNRKLDLLATQLAAVGSTQASKFDGLASQVSANGQKVDALGKQIELSSQKVDSVNAKMTAQLAEQAATQEMVVSKLAAQLDVVVARFDPVETGSTSSTLVPSMKTMEQESTAPDLTSEVTPSETEKPLPSAGQQSDAVASSSAAGPADTSTSEAPVSESGKRVTADRQQSVDLEPLLDSNMSADDIFGQLLEEQRQKDNPPAATP